MNRLRSVVISGAVLVVSTACAGYGLWMLRDGAIRSDHAESSHGLLIMFVGGTVVPFLLTILINRFIPGERSRLHRPRTPARNRIRIKNIERTLKRLRFVKRHPSALLAFILVALTVLSIGALAPADSTEDYDQAAIRHVLCALFGAAYVVALAAFFYARFSKRWESYINDSITLTENRLERARLSEDQPSS